MIMREVRKKVLRRIVPSKKEQIKLEGVVNELYGEIDEIKPDDAKTMLVGSVAKDTYLKHSFDIDFFLLFPETYTKDELADIVLHIGKDILNDWTIQYAEHPYIRGFYRGCDIDIVPCYLVKNSLEKLSAVDRTPFHTNFIRRNLQESMKNEVRLLKQFLKGIGCYGAEAKVEGFSGYLTELLVLKYGTFMEVLMASQSWQNSSILSLNDFSERGQGVCFSFIDPVDATRNVAAALSREKLTRFVYAAGKFLENSKVEFFFPKKAEHLSEIKLSQCLQNFIGICFKKPEIADDILYPQLKKAAGSISSLFELHDFKVIRKAWSANENAFAVVELECLKLNKEKLHMGPPLINQNHAKKFIEKWTHHERTMKPPFEKEGRLWTIIEREYTDAASLLSTHLRELSIGKTVRAKKRPMHLCAHHELAAHAAYWDEYFSEIDPWDR